MAKLYNKYDKETLMRKLEEHGEDRVTLSFYKYAKIGNPEVFRDHFYLLLSEIDVLGRVYVANEGVNAQVSVPKMNFDLFRGKLEEITFLKGVRLNVAIEQDSKSFLKLKIKVRNKIVADGLDDAGFDVTKRGQHLSAEEFNKLTDDPNTVIVDMRNHYESEVGHFLNAITPDVDTFRDALNVVGKELEDKKDKNIVMYCTGGIRCEKASAYYKHKGFKNVYQLDGGIIEYARQVKNKGLDNKYIGKNFVFDERLGERISDEVISVCHQCGGPCDTHTNCRNVACNLLFIQCEKCAEKYGGCCSHECEKIAAMPEEEQRAYRSGKNFGRLVYKKGRSEKLKFKRAGEGV